MEQQMPVPTEYLQFARECHRLALQAGDQTDRELLQQMAKAWTELAVDKSAPTPEQPVVPYPAVS